MPNSYVAPTTTSERTIASIWGDLLGIGQVGVHDNFLDLGGHSLLATRMISKLRDTFKVELSVRSIFEAQTVAELAAIVEKKLRERNNLADILTELDKEEDTHHGRSTVYRSDRHSS